MSSLIDEIKKLQPSHITTTIGIVLSVVAPGFLIVLHYWPKLFYDLDNVKLFFLALSLSLPVLSINTFAIIGAKPNANVHRSFFSAMIISFIMLYLCLLIAWYLKLSFGQFVALIFVIEICGLFASFLSHFRTQHSATPTKKLPPS